MGPSSQFRWNSTNVFGTDVGLFQSRSQGGARSNSSDAVPMEIDRVKGRTKMEKAKGKMEGKGKGGKSQVSRPGP